jgi:hypothetical protein
MVGFTSNDVTDCCLVAVAVLTDAAGQRLPARTCKWHIVLINCPRRYGAEVSSEPDDGFVPPLFTPCFDS